MQTTPLAVSLPRVRVFVDYWNFQLSLNQRAGGGDPAHRFKVDWKIVGEWLAARAATTAGLSAHTYEGVFIYTSYNPQSDGDRKFHRWATTILNRFPGVKVQCRERKPKEPPRCPACHTSIEHCPKCNQTMRGTQEKGVDTLIATEMIGLAWAGAFDLAVLVTSDRDLVPAVEFLDQRGYKVIHAAFPPLGSDLSNASWASFDVLADCEQIRRS